ncbi:S26 family signal peptidase [Rugosimonospora africana]|uniref:S26 family signal peptidase n=1 Tax=Rugosimonospora africana TaxID=556532 RepID=UPI0019452B00|nr:S26 family signal peptidase [Rugosimonospora africana]
MAVVLWAAVPVLAFVAGWRWAIACTVPALILTCGLLASALLARGLVAVTVHGQSMEPTYHDGDRVLVRRGAVLERGQVVVLERPLPGGHQTAPPIGPRAGAAAIASRRWIIKRVVAVPGDPVPREAVPGLTDTPDDRVPAGRVVLLGDNPAASFDSRQAGYFPLNRVLGRVFRPAR